MKRLFSKYHLAETFTITCGCAGTLSVILGGGLCLGGLTATGIIKAGEFLSKSAPAYRKAMFYGGVASSAGLFLIGAGAAAAAIRDKLGEQERERINIRREEALHRSESPDPYVPPEDRSRTWTEWEEYEEIKRFCRGCQYYQGGGRCALHQESRAECGDRLEKSSCATCKYYNNDDLLPCAVHPLGLRENCPDWQPNTED